MATTFILKVTMINGKVWGVTELIYRNDSCEVHRIQIKKNCYCSKHQHKYKHNIFYIYDGKLKITVWKKDYDLIDETILGRGDMTDVSPNEYHMFEALEDTEALEIYYPEPISADIIRESCGGNGLNERSKLC